MAVKTYSKKTSGDKQLSVNFKAREFACKDGSDAILVDSDLVTILQKIRDHFGKPVSLTSGYRTSTYNKKVGGATNSYHVKGQAADITISGIHPQKIAQYAESLKVKGVGLYDYGGGSGFVHVDTRASKYYWKQTSRKGGAKAVSGFGGTITATPSTTSLPTLKYGSRGDSINYLQKILIQKGYRKQAVNGKFGGSTEKQVKAFQKDNKLAVDGIVGSKTWAKLEG